MTTGGTVGFVCLLALAGWGDLAFKPSGAEFRFDTGALRGTFRAGGRSLGVGPVVDVASYFQGFPLAYGSGVNGLVAAKKELGDWLSFPRDAAAEAIIADGRWGIPPHPVTFKPVARYAGALGVRRDPKSGLTAMVMAPPADCFAVLMPYGEEGHRSLYQSLFGRDFKDGEKATARARLVIGQDIADRQAILEYETYLKEMKR